MRWATIEPAAGCKALADDPECLLWMESGHWLMRIDGQDLRQALDGNPLALLNGQRVAGRLQLDIGPQAAVTQVDHRLQIFSVGITLKLADNQPK